MAEQTVTLQPGESKQVVFEAIPQQAKVYQVSIDGLTGSFVAVMPPVASLRGTVLHKDHSPAVNRLVVISVTYEEYKAGKGLKTYTNSSGVFYFDGLSLGRCNIWIYDTPYPMSRKTDLVEGLNVVGPYILS